MENRKYEYLRLVKTGEFELFNSNINKVSVKIKVSFDKAVKEKEVYALSKKHGRAIKYQVLELASFANIQHILQDACGGDIENINNIAFNSLKTVLKFIACNKQLLSEDESTDFIVFGNKKLFFIARVHKTLEGISVYVGLSNFDLPYSVECKHKLFTCLK